MNQLLATLFIIAINTTAIAQTVDFTYESTNGLFCTPAQIKFTKTVTGDPTGYVWTFGNNMGSNSENPTTTYTTAGTYTVRLIAIYKRHTVETSKTIVINPAVPAGFLIDRNELCMPGTITFKANATQNITAYKWNFGDNDGEVTTTSPVISHNFTEYRVFRYLTKQLHQQVVTGNHLQL